MNGRQIAKALMTFVSAFCGVLGSLFLHADLPERMAQRYFQSVGGHVLFGVDVLFFLASCAVLSIFFRLLLWDIPGGVVWRWQKRSGKDGQGGDNASPASGAAGYGKL